MTSVKDRVDGVREASETIVRECNVTFELYRILSTIRTYTTNSTYTTNKIYVYYQQYLRILSTISMLSIMPTILPTIIPILLTISILQTIRTYNKKLPTIHSYTTNNTNIIYTTNNTYNTNITYTT